MSRFHTDIYAYINKIVKRFSYQVLKRYAWEGYLPLTVTSETSDVRIKNHENKTLLKSRISTQTAPCSINYMHNCCKYCRLILADIKVSRESTRALFCLIYWAAKRVMTG